MTVWGGNIQRGGTQDVPQIAVQYIYLDFDGELTSYNGEILSLDTVEVQNSSLTEERIQNILAELNARYADQKVVFVTQRPTVAGYSTIFVGKTTAFDQYGNFAGLAETIDEGNTDKTDKAFVMLDSTATDTEIISTIVHETDHLLGTLNHGGEGLQAYAARYDVSSGITSSGITLNDDSMYVSSGGTAAATTVNGGALHVSSGGTATSTTVNGEYEEGYLVPNPYGGGVVWIEGHWWEGYLYVSSGGTATSTTVNDYGHLEVSSGGTATHTTVNSMGKMYVLSGGTATSTTVNSSGYLYVYAGGTATSTTVNSSGYLYVSSGGTAISTTVNGGLLDVSSGGTATSTTVNSGGLLSVSSGGTAASTTVKSGGYIFINGNGIVEDLTLKAGGNLGSFAFSEDKYFAQINGSVQIASHVSIIDDRMIISSGGTATSTTVNSSGYLYVSSGGTAASTMVNGGYLYVSSGGTATSTTVNSSGYLSVSSGGTATSTTVNGGYLYVSSGGTATAIKENGGYVNVADGANVTFVPNTISGLVLSNTAATLHSGTTATSTTVDWGGLLSVSSGGTATSTTVDWGGSLYVSSGGTATSTTVNSYGYLYVYAGGTATAITANFGARLYLTVAPETYIQGTSAGSGFEIKNGYVSGYTVNSGGSMYVSSGGTATSTTVNDGGRLYVYYGGTATSTTVNDCVLYVSSGGTATDIVWTPCVGYVAAADGAYVTYASQYSGVYFGSNNQLLSHANVMDGKGLYHYHSMYVMSGGTATSTTVNRGGSMYVSSGGTATSTTVNGYAFTSLTYYEDLGPLPGDYVVEYFDYVFSSSNLYVYAGGTATSTTVNSGGGLYVSSGGTATATMVNGYTFLYHYQIVDNRASYARVDFYSYLYVYDGGTVTSTTVNSGGRLWVSSGGTATSTTVNSGGHLYVSGGIHRGSLQLKAGAVVSAYEEGFIDFTVSDRTTADDYLINDLSRISGAPIYTITVSADQESGTYKLAQGAGNFTGTLTVGDGTVNYGSVTVNGEVFRYNGTKYTLTQTNGDLLLGITEAVPSVFIYSSGTLISSGSVISGASLVDGGNNSMYVSSGGTATSTTVNSGGYLDVCSGGTATSTTVNSGGSMCVSSGGTATSTTVNSDGYLSVSSGGTATSTTVNSGGYLCVNSGGTANSTTVYSSGTLDTSSGGTANDTTVNSKGKLYVFSGGIASATTVNLAGHFEVRTGGTANVTTLNDWGYLYVDSRGSANSTTVNSNGNFYVRNGGTANSVTVNVGGLLYVSTGGKAFNIVENGGYVSVAAGANVTFIPNTISGLVLSNTSATLHSVTTANDTTVNPGGYLYVSSGGTATSTTVNEGGWMYVYDGGTATVTTVDNGGAMYVGGTATSTTVNYGYLTVSSGGTAASTTVADGGTLTISSGGTAASTIVADGGTLTISSGGTASVVFNPWGKGSITSAAGANLSYIYSGVWYGNSAMGLLSTYNSVSNLEVTSGNSALVYAGGIMNSAVVNSGGYLTISSGGTASVVFNPWGKGRITSAAGANLSYIYSGVWYGNSAAGLLGNYSSVSNLEITSGNSALVYAGGSVNSAVVNAGGTLNVSSGGTASVVFNPWGGSITSAAGANLSYIYSGVYYGNSATGLLSTYNSVSNLEITSGNSALVYAGGIMNSAVVNSGGTLYVSSGGTASVVFNPWGGSITSAAGANFSYIYSGVWYGNTAAGLLGNYSSVSNLEITSGNSALVYAGGIMNSAVVNAGGTLYVSSGGTASVVFNPWGGSITSAAGANFSYIYSGVWYGNSAAGLLSTYSSVSNLEITSGNSALVYESGRISNAIVRNGGMLYNSGGVVAGLSAYAGAVLAGDGVFELTSNTFVASGVAEQTQDQQYTSTRIFSGFSNFVAGSGLHWRVGTPIQFKETYVRAGGRMSFDSGASATKIDNAGTVDIGNNANLRSMTNTGVVNISQGGMLVLNTNAASGVENVWNGGSSWRTVNLGTQRVFADGIADSTTIHKGGDQQIFSNGQAISAFVSSGGSQTLSGGVANSAFVLAGGWQHVSSGGYALETLVDRGYQHVYSDGKVFNTEVSYGSQYVSSGGFASATEVYGTFQTFSSAIVSRFDYAADYVYWYNSGGSRHMIHDGWVDYTSTVQTVYWFGYNGSQAILEGGLAHDTVLSSGAIQTVDFGGSASKTVVGKDAFQYVLAGGEVFDTQVNSGGILVVEYDGYGENITVSSGGAVGIHGVVRDLTIDRDADYYFHMGEAVFQGYLNCYLTQKSLEALQEILPFSNDLEELYLQVDDSTLREGVYKLADGVGSGFSTTISIGHDRVLSVNGDARIVGDKRYSLDLTNGDLYITIEKHVVTPPEGSINGIYWADAQGALTYVEYSTDNFDTALKVQMPTGSLDTFGIPAGKWQWRVSNDNGSSWQNGKAFQSQNQSGSAQEFRPVTNGHNDLFFAAADGTWNAQYGAQHLGTEFWNGTGEKVLLQGKNKIADIFEGSRDANILVLTDDANGDALFVDDVYTALGDQARLAQIDEIRAGAGDDIVDMTSQRYAYAGDGVKVYGGLGNDTIWANKGSNTLFGDAGNDRLVGASGNDILAGGSGNDSMHGGGGSDIFTFGGAWGNDTIEQLADGSVTLWFAGGSEANWNAESLTYSDGVNSVSVSGCVNVTLRFGSVPSLPAGAFADAASEKIFEDKNSGMLA